VKQGEPNEDDLKPRHYPEVLDPDQAADYLGIGRTALFELLREGAIPHRRLTPKVIRFGRDALKEWIDTSGVSDQAPAAAADDQPAAADDDKPLFTTPAAPDPPARVKLDETEIMSDPVPEAKGRLDETEIMIKHVVRPPAPSEKAKMGPAEKKRQFIELISSGISDAAALKEMGSSGGSRATVARWRDSDPEFEAVYEQIDSHREDFDQ
jgi:excisionase family DNA binding protein